MLKKKFKPCVIGLGYVGLPIIINLCKKYKSIGYDIEKKRINELKNGKDIFGEINHKNIKNKNITYVSDIKKISTCNLYIVTVPTPIFKNKKPDLSHITDVCVKLSKIIKLNDIIIFESTVYPGVTNDVCIPLLQKYNNFLEGKDFFVGYSPERVNPGDNRHKLRNINKILSYPHHYKKKELITIYSLLAKKIIYTKNVKEAETAKVIENIQRDVNIGLINEIYLVCKKLNLNFNNIMELASTKWNFLKFNPGLVGGHCLPVDPYYFSYISKKHGFKTRITLAGRFINDSMVKLIVKNINLEINKLSKFDKKKILICGLSYKKDVADTRNSLALKIFNILKMKHKSIMGYDPYINQIFSKKNLLIHSDNDIDKYKVLIILTNHSIFKKKFKKFKKLKNKIFINPLS